MKKITLIETSKEHEDCFDVFIDGVWIESVSHTPLDNPEHRRFNDMVSTLTTFQRPLGEIYKLEVIWD